MRTFLSVSFSIFFALSCKTEPKHSPSKVISETIPEVHQWALGNHLQHVESVLYDSTNNLFYASCGKEYKVGTEGFIAKMSPTGNLLESKWIKNLNRPTGMALYDTKLYVADVDRIVIIDVNSGKLLDSVPEPIKNSGLNDVAISATGRVFVTASFVHSIFELVDGKLIAFLKDDKNLEWANGIMFDGESLVVGGTNLIKINIQSKNIDPLSTSPKVFDFDGLVADGIGGYYATTVENSTLWHINSALKATKLASDSYYFGDMDYIPKEKRLVIARGKPKTNSFFIESRTVFK
ncbi:hypothetical protein [Flagellimonas meishanensis]|uniref:hypothetical protein n=1 Tax=Flagellimonas meishanensis TaxID=2873264 RepID=UPI001CA6F519|nr:hypothetical protein [[Muricauda] meishanensis]